MALALPPQTVHIWLIDPTTVADTALLDAYHQLLAPEEHSRWQRYKFAKDKHQHLVTRALVRDTLSRYAPEISPDAWRFECNSHGKPSIANPLTVPLRFNLSHTQNRAALAVIRGCELGVDVEKIKTVEHVRGMTERCFSEEESRYILRGDPSTLMWRFFKLWTLKEAYIKACGRGLSISLQALSFQPLAHPMRIAFGEGHVDDPDIWSFRTWQLGDDHLLSLAIPQPADTKLHVEFFQALPMRDFSPLQFAEVVGR